jgi:hypothetical protein
LPRSIRVDRHSGQRGGAWRLNRPPQCPQDVGLPGSAALAARLSLIHPRGARIHLRGVSDLRTVLGCHPLAASSAGGGVGAPSGSGRGTELSFPHDSHRTCRNLRPPPNPTVNDAAQSAHVHSKSCPMGAAFSVGSMSIVLHSWCPAGARFQSAVSALADSQLIARASTRCRPAFSEATNGGSEPESPLLAVTASTGRNQPRQAEPSRSQAACSADAGSPESGAHRERDVSGSAADGSHLRNRAVRGAG